MKHKSPKQLRIDKKKPRFLSPGIQVVETDVSFVVIGHGSRVEKLPPYEEYKPNKIHVARRRRAWKEHTTFPRGWTWGDEETGDINVIGSGAATAYDPTSLLEDYFFAEIRENNG